MSQFMYNYKCNVEPRVFPKTVSWRNVKRT